MVREATSAPAIIQAQLQLNAERCQHIAKQLKAQPPRAIMMIGRGTSDHAGVFAKYLFEVECGIPVFAAAPSVAGIYKSQLQLDGCLAICISQSGKSPDIIQQAKTAKAGGARVLALVNVEDSPLAQLADEVLPLHAEPELAVAATKSYLASLSALCQLCAYWQSGHQSAALLAALDTLPTAMEKAQQQPPQLKADDLKSVKNCIVLGRGFGYAIAREIALKLKEVLGIHAEAFSSAEFLHGPVTLAERELCVIDVNIDDESGPAHQQQMQAIAARGAKLLPLQAADASHARLQPLVLMQRFYLDVEHAARQLDLDPDAPPGLNKVTETH
ncbi:Glutamine--fructose-6-phosphate aminotransferase [isomerizing] [Pseudidiomarina piscicola]|uniref:Glutamine--fructose-6-phosphate aminotransferase [isomerizing] n=1 Tax=Pseudidiomarina piscicola TaxID=2614830 RepID=A0A6S6WL05_9GAMM|nr:Glutamine--fructose-6-phosphate aminotransferase [isomerizing] [Pseudidiomarina piscicola]VZT40238.1 Glutamine--fructose-6-phosphate aminotransferase [isomerizing] [Pseudomonas aeruginosa]